MQIVLVLLVLAFVSGNLGRVVRFLLRMGAWGFVAATVVMVLGSGDPGFMVAAAPLMVAGVLMALTCAGRRRRNPVPRLAR